MGLASVPIRTHPVLTLSNRTITWYSDGSGFWGGVTVRASGSMFYTTAGDFQNILQQPLAATDESHGGNSFSRDFEVRCIVLTGTRDATHSTLANNTWEPASGEFYLDITGGTFSVEFRYTGGPTVLASAVFTVS